MAWADLLQTYMANRTFAAVLAEQWLLTADPDIRPMWHSSQISEGGFNFSGLNNPQVDRLLDEASQVEDRTRRAQLYSEFQGLWAEEVPSIVLYYPKFAWAVNRNVKEVKLSSFTDGSARFRHVAQWYVRTKQVPQSR